MLYAIIAEDVPDSSLARQRVRPDHLARLRALQDDGRLLLAGPHPAVDSDDVVGCDYTGSLIVAEFPSLDDAESWAAADPYRVAGVYARVVVKPFKRVFPQ